MNPFSHVLASFRYYMHPRSQKTTKPSPFPNIILFTPISPAGNRQIASFDLQVVEKYPSLQICRAVLSKQETGTHSPTRQACPLNDFTARILPEKGLRTFFFCQIQSELNPCRSYCTLAFLGLPQPVSVQRAGCWRPGARHVPQGFIKHW